MAEHKYDIFISYRRKGGYETAKHLYDLLTKDGYSVSFDIDTLRSGDFDTSLLSRIDECKDFILIIDPHTFDRTFDRAFDPHKDWLRQELAQALKRNKNIVPIMLTGVDGFPQNLPSDINGVVTKNGPEYSQYYFDEFYETLKKRFLISSSRYQKPESNYNLFFKYRRYHISFVVIFLSLLIIPVIYYRMLGYNYSHDKVTEGEIDVVDSVNPTLDSISHERKSPDNNRIVGLEDKSTDVYGDNLYWENGIYNFSGLFNFKGVDYNFELQINYDKISEEVREVKYKPDYSTAYSKISGKVSISSDGRTMIIDGKSEKSKVPLYIFVTKENGKEEFSGSMLRGDNRGECRLYPKQ